MRHFGWCGLILIFGLRTTFAQGPPIASIVTIAVTDPSGAAISKAEVVVMYRTYMTGNGAELGSKETNEAGEVQFLLSQRGYDVTVNAPGCLGAAKHVDVTDSRAERVALTTHMYEDCNNKVAYEPTLIPAIDAEPLTTIVEVPLPTGPTLQASPSPGKKHAKQPLTLNPRNTSKYPVRRCALGVLDCR